MKKCIIIGSSPSDVSNIIKELDIENSYIICADGGLDYALKYNIKPNLVIGDFDSLQGELPNNVETIKLPTQKDDTDMMAALKEALNRGFDDFVLLRAFSGRPDHSYANLCALQFLCSQGCKAVIADNNGYIFILNKGKLTLNELKGRTVSVFPFGGYSCTVSYEGMKYPLDEACLTSDNPLGVSNEIISDDAYIIVHTGNAVIFLLSK
jgi:thiamine pyrophosphokinase